MVDRTLVLAGGGHAHVEILRRLAERPIEGVRTLDDQVWLDAYIHFAPQSIEVHQRIEVVTLQAQDNDADVEVVVFSGCPCGI
jgi:hypothetical protein